MTKRVLRVLSLSTYEIKRLRLHMVYHSILGIHSVLQLILELALAESQVPQEASLEYEPFEVKTIS